MAFRDAILAKDFDKGREFISSSFAKIYSPDQAQKQLDLIGRLARPDVLDEVRRRHERDRAIARRSLEGGPVRVRQAGRLEADAAGTADERRHLGRERERA